METNLFRNTIISKMEPKNWLEINASDNKNQIIQN